MPSLRALADCYRTGDGAPDDKPNLPLAFAYYEEAARQGDNHSLKILGDLYWHGDGCVKDRAKAADFYENAVASGESESLHCLARCYWFGKGVERDKSLARDLWKQYLVTKQDLVPPDELSGLISLPDEDLEEIMEKLDEQTAL
ncbi:hypothetical protein BC832DRAFT_546828 [Gaertneriomyces semiglobifer]|nr:hypothetical protein BC832DRAFT_546828 [Gaertneriomyces semiglobifer]